MDFNFQFYTVFVACSNVVEIERIEGFIWWTFYDFFWLFWSKAWGRKAVREPAVVWSSYQGPDQLTWTHEAALCWCSRRLGNPCGHLPPRAAVLEPPHPCVLMNILWRGSECHGEKAHANIYIAGRYFREFSVFWSQSLRLIAFMG